MPAKKKNSVEELLSTHKTKRSASKKRPPSKQKNAMTVLTEIPVKTRKKKSMEMPTEAPMDQTELVPELSDSDSDQPSPPPSSVTSSDSDMISDMISDSDLRTPPIGNLSEEESVADEEEEKEEDTEVYGIQRYEALALGIGEPEALSDNGLLRFYSIIDSKDANARSINSPADRENLNFEAKQYLVALTPEVITEKAVKMSGGGEIADRFYAAIKDKINEYRAELQNAQSIVDTAIGKFDAVANNSDIDKAERDKFKTCLGELKKYQKQLRKNGFGATIASPPASPKKWSTLKVAGAAVAGVGLAAVAGRVAWDAGLKDKLMRTPLVELETGKPTFFKTQFNRYAKFLNRRQNLPFNNPDEILKDLNIILPNGEMVNSPPGTLQTVRMFLQKVPDSISRVWNNIIDQIEVHLPGTTIFPENAQELAKELILNKEECKNFLEILFTALKGKLFKVLTTYTDSDLLGLLRDKKGDNYIGQAALIIWFSTAPPNIIQAVQNYGQALTDTNKEKKVEELVEEIMTMPLVVINNWLYNCPIFFEEPAKNISLSSKQYLFEKSDYNMFVGRSEWVQKMIVKLTELMKLPDEKQEKKEEQLIQEIATLSKESKGTEKLKTAENELQALLKTPAFSTTAGVEEI